MDPRDFIDVPTFREIIMLSQYFYNDATIDPAFKIFDRRSLQTAKKWRPLDRAFVWVTSAIASWMLLARLAELVISD